MGFFKRKPKNNREYIDAERRGDDERRRRFEESQGSPQPNKMREIPVRAPTKDDINGVMDKLRSYREQSRLRGFQKQEEKQAQQQEKDLEQYQRNQRVTEEAEKKTFGRVLTDDERKRYQNYRTQKSLEYEARRQKAKSLVSSFGSELLGSPVANRKQLKRVQSNARNYEDRIGISAASDRLIFNETSRLRENDLHQRRLSAFGIGTKPKGGSMDFGMKINHDQLDKMFSIGSFGAKKTKKRR